MSEREDTIKEAFRKLDPDNADHWTAAGLPDMERMKEITGLADLKREEVGRSMPGLTRENVVEMLAAGGSTGGGGNTAEAESTGRLPTAQEIAEHVPDPILLLEAAVAAANGSDRHRRNGPLHAIIRHFMVDQVAIRDHQERLDKRDASREAERAKAAG